MKFHQITSFLLAIPLSLIIHADEAANSSSNSIQNKIQGFEDLNQKYGEMKTFKVMIDYDKCNINHRAPENRAYNLKSQEFVPTSVYKSVLKQNPQQEMIVFINNDRFSEFTLDNNFTYLERDLAVVTSQDKILLALTRNKEGGSQLNVAGMT